MDVLNWQLGCWDYVRVSRNVSCERTTSLASIASFRQRANDLPFHWCRFGGGGQILAPHNMGSNSYVLAECNRKREIPCSLAEGVGHKLICESWYTHTYRAIKSRLVIKETESCGSRIYGIWTAQKIYFRQRLQHQDGFSSKNWQAWTAAKALRLMMPSFSPLQLRTWVYGLLALTTISSVWPLPSKGSQHNAVVPAGEGRNVELTTGYALALCNHIKEAVSRFIILSELQARCVHH